jgi:hypothetical protein
MAPVEIPVKVAPEMLEIPDLEILEEQEPRYEPPPLDPIPPFEAPVPEPRPQLVLPNRPKSPPPPQVRRTCTHLCLKS